MELFIDAGGEVEVVEKLRDLTERQNLTDDWKYKNFLLELGCYLSFAVARLGGYCLVCGQGVASATRASPLNICTRVSHLIVLALLGNNISNHYLSRG